ncbi:MAG: AAA family ATPase [Nitrospirota bacterium]
MKLKTVRVRMFRNILDSTEVAIEDKVTCLVGKNESGKSAFLNALWRVKPARSKPEFVIHDHYPAWPEKRHRNEGVNQKEFEPVEVGLEWEPADVKVMEEKFGPGVVTAGTSLRLWKNYSNEFRWESGCKEQQAVRNFVAKNPVPAAEQAAYAALADFEALKAKLAADVEKSKEAAEDHKLFTNAQSALKTLLGREDNFNDAAWSVAKDRLPEFFYFAEYSKLPYSVKIQDVLKNDKLSESDATARALLILGGTEREYMLNPDYERRKRELENVANALTDDVNSIGLRILNSACSRTLRSARYRTSRASSQCLTR